MQSDYDNMASIINQIDPKSFNGDAGAYMQAVANGMRLYETSEYLKLVALFGSAANAVAPYHAKSVVDPVVQYGLAVMKARWQTSQASSGGGSTPLAGDDKREPVAAPSRPSYDDMVTTRAEWGAGKPRTGPGLSWEPAAKPGQSLAECYDTIVIHHTGNEDDYIDDPKDLQEKSWEEGRADIPYHFAINRYGEIFEGRPINIKGAHVENGNTGKIGIVLMADLDTKDSGMGMDSLFEVSDGAVSIKMRESLDWLLEYLDRTYGIVHLAGHKEAQSAANGEDRYCPGDLGMKEVVRARDKFGFVP